MQLLEDFCEHYHVERESRSLAPPQKLLGVLGKIEHELVLDNHVTLMLLFLSMLILLQLSCIMLLIFRKRYSEVFRGGILTFATYSEFI